MEAVLARVVGRLGTVWPAGCTETGRTSLVVLAGRGDRERLADRVREVKRRLAAERGSENATLALSAPVRGVAGLSAAASEATLLAALQEQADGAPPVASFAAVEDVGALRVLFPLRESGVLREFVADAIGPLQQHDRRGALRATLRAFLESGGSQVEAALRLGIHRNTLAYRLRRIADLTGRDVTDPRWWLTMHLALRAEDVLTAAARPPGAGDVEGG
jgi:DNA-binding PucR family transcriptional regulator